MTDITKIQEILYELQVSEVMTSHVVTVTPQTTMSQFEEVLRTRRISGTPVVDDTGNLIGIVSIMDLIQALDHGQMHEPVADHMTTDVEVLHDNERVISAINRQESTGYGRFPVVSHSTGMLVGILTRGDIIRGTLKQLDMDYRRLEAQGFRQRHFFEDILSENTSIVLRYTVLARDLGHGGEASSHLKRSLTSLGIRPEILRRVAVATYEAEMNLVLHATNGGRIRADIRSHQLRIDVTDHGPGIEDIEQAMRPGFSTAAEWIREMGFGAGMGLTNIRNCADEMSLDSKVGRGTHLRILFRLDQAQQ